MINCNGGAVKQNNYRILVVDDEVSMRDVLSIMLHREGYHVDAAADGAQAVKQLQENRYDLVISDVQMPRMDGLQLLQHLRERSPDTVVIMITAFSSTEQAVEAMKQGAYDYIIKPFKNEEIRIVIKNALERKMLREENLQLKKELEKRYSFAGLIGKSKPMQVVYTLVEKVADSRVNVLVTGESGTGKELVARAIHYQGERKGEPFIPINCGAIPENLLESELFGHEKGSFTGAIRQKEGLIESASGGTLFLDEIGELPAMMQVKLLRVLQEREIRRVGGTRNIPVDIRLIAATNKDLEAEVAQGKFREDLYYRLNVVPVHIPPLRERREDIPLLIEHFIAQTAGEVKMQVSDGAMRRLLDYAWPGNVRELENIIERCLVLGGGDELDESALPTQMTSPTALSTGFIETLPDEGFNLDAYLGGIEKEVLLKALEKSVGVRKRAAEYLGITFRSIRYRLAKFDLGEDDEG
ncbi:MAG: sigma-54-dependent Fis family transcriptional regulator [Desulfuromonadales bacterium]|nr:sigma-54-dependent Fis family transcriptional regulator [Desulfuromonadales bacterium]